MHSILANASPIQTRIPPPNGKYANWGRGCLTNSVNHSEQVRVIHGQPTENGIPLSRHNHPHTMQTDLCAKNGCARAATSAPGTTSMTSEPRVTVQTSWLSSLNFPCTSTQSLPLSHDAIENPFQDFNTRTIMKWRVIWHAGYPDRCQNLSHTEPVGRFLPAVYEIRSKLHVLINHQRSDIGIR